MLFFKPLHLLLHGIYLYASFCALYTYYSSSDHDRKMKLQREIANTINQQLTAQSYDSAILQELQTINLAENDQFFLWHTWFSDVFSREEGKTVLILLSGIRRMSLSLIVRKEIYIINIKPRTVWNYTPIFLSIA